MRVMSIDQSLSCSGVIIWGVESTPLWCAIKTDNSNDVGQRLYEIVQRISLLIKHYEVDVVVLENLAFGSNSPSVRPLAGLFYAIWLKCIELNVKFDTVGITQVKRFATNSGKAKKEDMINAFCTNHAAMYDSILSHNFKKSTGLADIVDAFFVGLYYNEQHNITNGEHIEKS